MEGFEVVGQTESLNAGSPHSSMCCCSFIMKTQLKNLCIEDTSPKLLDSDEELGRPELVVDGSKFLREIRVCV